MVDSSGSPITSPGVEGLLIFNGGTVCNDSFSYNSAHAICKLMGFDRFKTWRSREPFSIRNRYQIALDDVVCNSVDWSSCSYRTDGHDCKHEKDVFLTCDHGKVKIKYKSIMV